MSRVLEAWENEPPPILYIAQPMPNSPALPLSGSGTATSSLQTFLNDLKTDLDNQVDNYFAYVMNSNKTEADTYTLVEWHVAGPTVCHQHVVLLYYQALNPYATLLKHMPDLAEDYRRDNPWEFSEAVEVLERSLGF
jgi:hypothetical protein